MFCLRAFYALMGNWIHCDLIGANFAEVVRSGGTVSISRQYLILRSQITTSMNRFTNRILALASVAMLGFGIASCTSTTEPIATVDAPTNVMVSVRSSDSIAVMWTRGTTDTSSDIIVATPVAGGSINDAANAVSFTVATKSTGTIGGLKLGQFYSIAIQGGNGTSAAVTYATSMRAPSSGLWRLYETGDKRAGHPSGIVLSNKATSAQGPISVGASNANRTDADLVFASDAGAGFPFISFVSPSVTSLSGVSAGRSTKFSNQISTTTAGLNGIWHNTGIESQIPSGTSLINVLSVDTATNRPLVFYVLTADANYCAVEVVPQTKDGQIFGVDIDGTTGITYRFVDCRISYQSVANAGYVSRGGQLFFSNEAPVRFQRH